jgi:hypothetical protein
MLPSFIIGQGNTLTHFRKSPLLPERWFLVLALIAVVATRIIVIHATPSNDDFIDLSIYCEVGELVVNGVDPYDVDARLDLRERLRLNDHGAAPYVKASKAGYDFYVTANLPASTLLYGLIEWLSGGSPHGWRFILISGDLAIALATFFFLRRVGVKLDTVETQIAFALSAVCYPSLIQWGTVLAEDKQLQTALMIALAGLLVSPGRSPRLNAASIGILGCLSVMFKGLGVFLAPFALYYFWGRPRREVFIAICAAAAVALPMILFFDFAFIVRMFNRAREGMTPLATSGSLHASPWSLIPYPWVFYARPIVSCALVGLTIAALVRGRIDLLNCSAAMSVVFVSLWLLGGSMDRMNVAMMFALACSATISVTTWRTLTIVNFLAQAPIYLAVFRHKQYAFGLDPEMPDAVATVIFVVSYFSVLFLSRSDQRLFNRGTAMPAAPPMARFSGAAY